MFLILGTEHDPCCAAVREALCASGRAARIVRNTFAAPARVACRIDSRRLTTTFAFDGHDDEPLEGVLVRGGSWIDPAGWEAADLAYVQAETHAALLAWLWALPCPVVNRCPAGLWYRPTLAQAYWKPLLRAAGLRTLPAIVSNVEDATRAFGLSREAHESGGVVYGPLSTTSQYLVSSRPEWAGVAALQQRMPVALTLPHGEPDLVCLVGTAVVWNGVRPSYGAGMEPMLRQLATLSRLTFLEVAIAAGTAGPVVVSVDHNPRIERFGDSARQRIVEAVTDLLAAPAPVAEAAS